MRLTTVKIRNFRGIQCLDLRLERDVTVLIGENNSGKTSILEAMRIGLDTIKSEKIVKFTEYDFYRAQDITTLSKCEPIKIVFLFEETTEHMWSEQITQLLNDVIVGDEFQIIKMSITGYFDSEDSTIKQTVSFLDNNDNEMSGKQGFIKELKKLRPFFYQSALRAAKDEFQVSGSFWSSFLKDKSVNPDTRHELENSLDIINRQVVDAHKSFKDVTNEVQNLNRLVSIGKANSVSVDPRPADFFQTIRSAEVNLLTASDAKIPIRSHGEGTQSLSVLLLFSAYLKTRLKADVDRLAEPIIAIEEPESHLHPNAIRALWPILCDLPGQKIIATHSGDILSEIPIKNLRRLNKKDAGCECCELPTTCLTPEENRKFNHHVRRNRGELLFARQWLLVEGETDVSVFTECADLLEIDLNSHGIRIVEYSQAGGAGIFIKVADALNICWYLVADNDDGGLKYVESVQELLNTRDQQNYISILEHDNTDILLCYSGYGTPYQTGIGWQKRSDLTEPENSIAYWKQVYKIVNKTRGFSKPAAALEALMLMRNKGKEGVPIEIKNILQKIISKTEVSTNDPA